MPGLSLPRCSSTPGGVSEYRRSGSNRHSPFGELDLAGGLEPLSTLFDPYGVVVKSVTKRAPLGMPPRASAACRVETPSTSPVSGDSRRVGMLGLPPFRRGEGVCAI